MMIKNSIIEGLTVLRFTLGRLQERERMLVLATAIFVLLFLWYLIAYLPQSYALNQTKTMIDSLKTSTTQLTQKKAMIESLIKDNSISKLLAKYQHLQVEMKQLGETFKHYQTRYIDYTQLNNLLFSILQQTSDVSIVKFSNTSTITKEVSMDVLSTPAAKPAPVTPTPAPGQAPNTGTNAAATPEAMNGPKVERSQYKLILKGTYGGITAYLNKLEGTGWQFYWDKLNYVVQKHPDAQVTVEFYTLRLIPADQDDVVKGGQS